MHRRAPTLCTNCPYGTYSVETGEIASMTCCSCPHGQTSPSDSTNELSSNDSCDVLCPAGAYRSPTVSATCLTCPADMHSEIRSTEIIDCKCNN